LAEKPREIAARLLLRREGSGSFVDSLLEAALQDSPLAGPDRGLLQEMVCGAVRWEATLDWLIAQRTGGRRQKRILQILLRLGLYQLFWLDRIPAHAAVNETVTLARQLGCGPQAGFINAVLRAGWRDQEALRRGLAELKVSQPALGFSHPAWLCDRWQGRWGGEKLRQLLDWNNTPPKTWARVNTLRTRLEPLRELWAEEKVEVKFQPFDWTGDVLLYTLRSPQPLPRLTSFNRGCFYVQDPSTLLAVHLLGPQPGETILDFCAAPGGKTTVLAQLMENRGRIVAHDPALPRLELVRQNCLRLGVTCVETLGGQEAMSALGSRPFDRVLVDAPCSNTGVLRRRVDLRWRIRPEEIDRLRVSQLGILRQAATLLKPGGVLVYATCSLEPEENEEVVRSFLEAQPGFRLEQARSLLPFVDGVDGAYAARLVRQG
jgi:16S rRNA (cytosine967-C5)-methyltransferase